MSKFYFADNPLKTVKIETVKTSFFEQSTGFASTLFSPFLKK